MANESNKNLFKIGGLFSKASVKQINVSHETIFCRLEELIHGVKDVFEETDGKIIKATLERAGFGNFISDFNSFLKPNWTHNPYQTTKTTVSGAT